MKLYLIVDRTEKNKALNSLLEAAKKRYLETEVVCSKTADFLRLPVLAKGDLLYRHGTSSRGIQIERLIIRDDVGHFYNDANLAISGRTSSYFYNEKAGLPVIKTIPLLPTSESNIQDQVDYLGGFPIIIKVMGGSNGVGIMRADSTESLKSILDYVRNLSGMILLRAFVPHDYYGRLVVVGDKVVASHRTYSMPGEFRTNASGNIETNKEGIVFSDEIQAVAVAAVHSTGLEFGGVDLLFSKEDEYQIAEVNFPCEFTFTEKYAKSDISGAMLDYLITKSTT